MLLSFSMIALFVESSLSCYRSRIPRSKALIAVIASLDKQKKRILTDNEKGVKATHAAVLLMVFTTKICENILILVALKRFPSQKNAPLH